MAILVPLIGLGGDQVVKSAVSEHNVKAYHADKHKSQDAYNLQDRLLSMDDEGINFISIILYISPLSL